MRTKCVARFLSLFLLACSAHASFAQDITGDLNTNIGDGSNVDSNNNTNAETNNYNSGAPGAMSNPVPTAMAPTMMGGGGNDSCLIPETSGVQISLFGIAQGRMKQDPECNRRKDSRLLGAPQAVGGLGLQVAGISRMCGDPMVFRAMALANTVCPVMNVNTGRLLIGRDAVEMYRENPEILIVGYADDKLFWDTLFRIGEVLDEIPTTSNTLSLSDRFRRNGRTDNNRPDDIGQRDNGSDKTE